MPRHGSGAAVTRFTTRDGRCNDHVRGIQQHVPSGDLLISTLAGVSKFDGRRFEMLPVGARVPGDDAAPRCMRGGIQMHGSIARALALALALAAGGCRNPDLVSTSAPLAAGVPQCVESPDGVPIRYRLQGAGEPLLLLIHGWSCDSDYWREQLPALTPHHAVLTVDLAGHGASGADRGEWTMERFGADVVAAVRAVHAVDLERFVAGFEGDFAGTTREWVRGSMFQPTADPRFADRIADDMAAAPPAVAIDAMRGLLSHLATHDYRDIAVPIVAINADLEGVTDDARARTVAPTFRLVTLPGRGHFLMLEDPAGFNPALLREVARLAR